VRACACVTQRKPPREPPRCRDARVCARRSRREVVVASVMCSPSKRREMDVMKLMMSDFDVEVENDNIQEFFVHFKGPKESPYEGGVWKVHVELPEAYPYRSPSIGFVNRIFHPNVDEMAGSVCLDVINQTWSPMFDLMREPEQYNRKVKEYVQRYALAEHLGDLANGKGDKAGGSDADDDDGFGSDSDNSLMNSENGDDDDMEANFGMDD